MKRVPGAIFFFFVITLLCACAGAPGTRGADAPAGLSEYPSEYPSEYAPDTPPDAPGEGDDPENLPHSSFQEIWGYLVSGREAALDREAPLSDIVYFGAAIDSYGQLTGVPNPETLAGFPGRIHLAAACDSRALTHFVLEPGSGVREALIAGLLRAARGYDGLQIDFELVPARDGEAFRSFLGELRRGLGGKVLSAAVPARQGPIAGDVYDYASLAPLVDRLLVMAYDEHWAASEPGPIASLDWCRATAAHALAAVGPEKLIMGLPFYGRTWGDVNAFRAFFYSGIERLRRENNVAAVERENSIPTFQYQIPLTVTVYYEDAYSLAARLAMYRAMGVRRAGFWSLGQETPAIWRLLALEDGS
jgi:spore germination protein YaaH